VVNYAPVYKERRRKVKLNTRRGLNRQKVKKAKEAAAERKAEQALRRLPRKWKKHDAEMDAMLKGVTWSH